MGKGEGEASTRPIVVAEAYLVDTSPADKSLRHYTNRFLARLGGIPASNRVSLFYKSYLAC